VLFNKNILSTAENVPGNSSEVRKAKPINIAVEGVVSLFYPGSKKIETYMD
jgi:hypothetical protein